MLRKMDRVPSAKPIPVLFWMKEVPKIHQDRFPQVSFPSDVLSDQQIAILCNIENGYEVGEKHERDLRDLVAEGYVEPVNEEPARYKLTGKAQYLLAQRGAGLNEA